LPKTTVTVGKHRSQQPKSAQFQVYENRERDSSGSARSGFGAVGEIGSTKSSFGAVGKIGPTKYGFGVVGKISFFFGDFVV